MINKYNEVLTFRIFNETDLQVKVVSYIKKNHPHALMQPGLGELQDTSIKRIEAWNKGYMKGQFDKVILNLHKRCQGLALEMKNPPGTGVLSKSQSLMANNHKLNGFKVLISNDYDEIILTIHEYFKNIRIKCLYCPRKFISYESIKKHIEGFHKRV